MSVPRPASLPSPLTFDAPAASPSTAFVLESAGSGREGQRREQERKEQEDTNRQLAEQIKELKNLMLTQKDQFQAEIRERGRVIADLRADAARSEVSAREEPDLPTELPAPRVPAVPVGLLGDALAAHEEAARRAMEVPTPPDERKSTDGVHGGSSRPVDATAAAVAVASASPATKPPVVHSSDGRASAERIGPLDAGGAESPPCVLGVFPKQNAVEIANSTVSGAGFVSAALMTREGRGLSAGTL